MKYKPDAMLAVPVVNDHVGDDAMIPLLFLASMRHE
jgi:hypothetical protein